MTLLPHHPSPQDDVWVALDLETTGLSAEKDEIIEVGAVKFQGDVTLDTFQSFVNPHRGLSDFVTRYTGITQEQVDQARPFSAVAAEFAAFVGSTPIVGHNIAFDLGFLSSKGLRLSNPRSDTWDLAYVLLPRAREYALARVASSMGIEHPRPHRAFDDAWVTGKLFLRLLEAISELDVYTLAEMERIASHSSWSLAYTLKALSNNRVPRSSAGALGASPLQQRTPSTQVGVAGFDIPALRERLKNGRALRPKRVAPGLDAERIKAILRDGGPLSRALPGFEERSEQIAMARAVADAINNGKRLVVEAGTGVGKSLAYLLPAALYALAGNKRVVISTNTINLQEQLLNKDVPTLVKALEMEDKRLGGGLRFSQLKGRANYLCLKRWHLLRSGDSLSDDEARLLSKVLVWLQSTATGDRSELNMASRSATAPWDRLSADGAPECAGVGGACFLRAAREKAAASHLVIVNHALLLSDLVAGGTLIPEHDVLIIDEAHHLEEVATTHLGFDLSQASIDDFLQGLAGETGLLRQAISAFRASSAAATRRTTVEEIAARITASLPALRDGVAAMFGALAALVQGEQADSEVRVTSATRSQPGWSQLEILWESADALLGELRGEFVAFNTSLEGLEEAAVVNYEGLVMEAANLLQVNTELRQRMAEFIPHPKPDGIYWVASSRRRGDLTLRAAPLHVGEHLEKLLYSRKESVVLTSATLSTNGSFDHIRERTGFGDDEELLLGSPFDYPSAALLCVPDDMPEPTSWAYQEAAEQAISDSAVAAGGRTMALFTSHASLQATAGAIRGGLQAQGFDVLAQGLDGTPHQLLRSFLDNPRSVLLGTASFWEGVDLAGESLKVLLLARLPFTVPTNPVFAARSEIYDDPFNQYAVPQAVLRIRQGFGRLIRTKTDKGVVVVLDRRIVSRRYGKAFLDSLPPTSFRTCKLHELSREIRGWI